MGNGDLGVGGGECRQRQAKVGVGRGQGLLLAAREKKALVCQPPSPYTPTSRPQSPDGDQETRGKRCGTGC